MPGIGIRYWWLLVCTCAIAVLEVLPVPSSLLQDDEICQTRFAYILKGRRPPLLLAASA